MGKSKKKPSIFAGEKTAPSSSSPNTPQEQASSRKLRDLLSVGADFDAPTQELWQIFLRREVAISDVAKSIMDGANANARNEHGISMLLLAIQSDIGVGFPLTRLIFEAGASLVDRKGKTPELNYAQKILDGGSCHQFLLGLDSVRKERAALDKATAQAAKSKPAPRM